MTDPLDAQQAAAISDDANLLVIAPPGCGKTELLALRALYLIPRLAPNQKILALTFTNRARANLSDRLRLLLGRDRFHRYVAVRNFHGHATEILLAHGTTLSIPVGSLKLPTSRTLDRALTRASGDAGSRRSAAGWLAELKRSPLSDEQVLQALQVPGRELALAVERERLAANEVHYEDLLRHCQRLLAVDEVANLYQQHYGAVLVDEFQDLSRQQLDIALTTCITSRTFVGDPMQGIYSWAGADPVGVETDLRALCGDPIPLSLSYRSSPAVLATLNGVSGRLGAPPLNAANPGAWIDGGASAALVLANVEKEAQLVAALSSQIVGGDGQATVGVITRSGWRRKAVDRVFVELPEIACRRWDLAVDDPAVLDTIRAAVATLPKDVSFDAARARTLSSVAVSDVDTREQIEDAFDQLAAVGAATVRAALQQFRVRQDDAPIEPGVHLLNAHTGKGQQFDWVIVLGLEEGHLPDRRSAAGEALAEEERVLLVMLSRAKHGVIMTRVNTLSGQYGPYAAKPSRWWGGLVSTCTMDGPTLKAHVDGLYLLT